MSFRPLTVIAALCCLSPSFVMANGCIDAPNRIYRDVKNYATTLSQRKFTWENMNWLQLQLGRPKVRKLSANKMEYTWQCSDDVDSTLLVITDAAGRFLYIKGQYNLESGSGMFEADINQQTSNEPIAAPKTITTTTTTIPPTLTPPTSAALPPAATSNPAVCENLVRQIDTDGKKYGQNRFTDKKDLPWMNLGWLQVQLGTPSSSKASDNLYKWDNYQLLQSVDGSVGSNGNFPGATLPTSPEEAIKVLGQPKNIDRTEYTKYEWRCSGDTKLSVFADVDNQLDYVEGSYCLQPNNCTDFSFALNPQKIMPIRNVTAAISVTKISTPTPAPTSAQLDIPAYNQHFHTNFTTEQQVQQDMIQHMKTYYLNLRNCTAGEYQLGVNVGEQTIFATGTIKGKQNDLCMVQEETHIGNPVSGQRILKICNDAPATLKFFTDPEAEAIATGNTNFNSQNLNELQRAELTQCKIYINGVPG